MRPASAGISANCCAAGLRDRMRPRRRFVLYSPEPLAARPSRDRRRASRSSPAAAARGGSRRRSGERSDAIRSTSSSRRPTPRLSGLSVPLAVTIHDVSFHAHPEWFRPREGLRRRWLTSRAARDARRSSSRTRSSRGTRSRLHLRVARSRIQVDSTGAQPAPPAGSSGSAARAARAVRRVDLQPAAAAAI